ncbi:MAG: Ig domain protein group 2 domain protein [Gemmatimonadetes bacterium]|nr:Ig domain protein group 2 domain protein [Gemmatimonadota bacterium]
MDSVTRKIVASVIVLAGLAACGDKVTTQPGTTTTVTQTGTTTTTPPGTTVQSVTVTPANVSLNIGQTQPIVAVVNADAGVTDRTVTWTSNNPTVATVSATGTVTAVASGTAVISAAAKADPTKIGTSTILVGAVVQPTIQLGQVNQLGAPAILGNIANQLDVVLNVEPGNQTIKTVDLILNCGAGDQIVATQTISADKTGIDAEAASAPVTLSFNTAQLKADGTPLFLNGNCTLKSQLTTATGTKILSQNSVQITLNNVSKYTYSYTTSATPAVSALDGLVRQGGNTTLSLTGVNYATSGALASITVTWLGRTTTATPGTGTQTFSISFPNDSTKTPGYGVCTTNCTGTYQYATAGVAEAAPVVTASIDANGNQSFAGTASTSNPALRLDNVSPAVLTSAIINSAAGSNNYVNGAYVQQAAGKIVIAAGAGDNAFANSQLTVKIGYAAPAAFTALVGGTGVGPVCSTTGLTMVDQVNQIPNSTANNAYQARVFVSDPIGNVRCADLSVSNGGTPAGNFFGIDRINPISAIASPAANTAVAVGTNYVFTFQDTISGFNPAAPVRVTLVRNFTTNFGASGTPADCVKGAIVSGACTPVSNGATLNVNGGTGVEGYYTVTEFAQDQATNVSTTNTRTNLYDVTAPAVGALSMSPSPAPLASSSVGLVGSTTVSGTATDNVDLASAAGTLDYATTTYAAKFSQGSVSIGNSPTFDSNVSTSAPASLAYSNIYRRLQSTDANGLIAAGGAVPNANVTATDAAGNVSTASNLPIAVSATGAADVNVGDSLLVKNSTTPVSKTGTNSTTLTAEVHTATVAGANQPFTQVNFYVTNAAGTQLTLIGSQSLAGVTDDNSVVPTGRRIWSYTLSGVTGAQLGLSSGSTTGTTRNIYVIGITSAGNAVLNSGQVVQVTVGA